jgi:transposase
MSKKKNKGYTTEFKQAAVKQANESDIPVAETARNLGINANTLYTWIDKYSQPEEIKTKVKTERTETHLYDELQQLKRENTRLRQERDFLKKAAAYFAKEQP